MTASFWTLPNVLTLSRIPLAILFIIFAKHTTASMIILALALLSDAEGTIARRTGTTTRIGAILDPIADKIFVITAVITLAITTELTAVHAYLILMREVFIAFFLLILAFTHRTRILSLMNARMYGKIATVLQFAVIFLIILNAPFLTPVIIATFLFSILASYDYLKKYRALAA